MTLASVINVFLVLALVPLFPGAVVAPNPTDTHVALVRAASGAFPSANLRGPRRVDTDALGVVTNAPSFVVRDVESGVTLLSGVPSEPRPMASITKLMTALVFLDDPTFNLERRGTVLREDVRDGGRWYIRFGDEVSFDQMLSVMLVGSGNNETLALVRELGLSEETFVARMNTIATELGMYDTVFVDPVGLGAGNLSTAYDVTQLLDAALANETIAERVRLPSYTFESRTGNTYVVEATDQLLDSYINRSPYAIHGGKTGFTDEAGACLTIRIERDGHSIDVTVLGAASIDGRFQDVKALTDWAFSVYEW
ncbi:hypothetical protein A3C17_02960 [Candidatus Uhrbacteria bacterium RIFCSPHIGHO2_02_FULL_53_13]|uniref:Peptidase S11 D-alanyl-D-alanine carboxypeptidase A N-terminal domain-containing protein n=2 Tax=Candidatus Uhriibacteriota TaxID=1752732 RepID=A0A1F7U0J9_9BACT|nr:MAG: hypothetical protein A3C17_02960 [Candidatus Uhrbacteria bacterium RIFCSPHIGHO2_02_FULL_53_13]OGL89079.1 MAG: hypothetical protein A3I45_02265 [Candidatus Uhrbacteria bacterium RIFCSPLOWO2_02_FULL_53_10]